jgi:hypothetical protein
VIRLDESVHTQLLQATSYATPIVSGIAALLLSLQLKHGQNPSPQAVRTVLLSSATRCDDRALDCRRLLTGRLNIRKAMSQLIEGGMTMSDSVEAHERAQGQGEKEADIKAPAVHPPRAAVQAAGTVERAQEAPASLQNPHASLTQGDSFNKEHASVNLAGITPSACGCGGGKSCTCGPQMSAQRVFALGQVGYDFGTEARRDSITQHMDGNPYDPNQLLSYLEANPWDASSILWTLNIESTPILGCVNFVGSKAPKALSGYA